MDYIPLLIQNANQKITPEIHLKIIELRAKGWTYTKIGEEGLDDITLDYHTVSRDVWLHNNNRCLCSRK